MMIIIYYKLFITSKMKLILIFNKFLNIKLLTILEKESIIKEIIIKLAIKIYNKIRKLVL